MTTLQVGTQVDDKPPNEMSGLSCIIQTKRSLPSNALRVVCLRALLYIQIANRKGHHHQTKPLKRQGWCDKPDEA